MPTQPGSPETPTAARPLESTPRPDPIGFDVWEKVTDTKRYTHPETEKPVPWWKKLLRENLRHLRNSPLLT